MNFIRKALSMLFLSLFIIFMNSFPSNVDAKDKTMIRKVAEGNTFFALDLYRQIKSEEGKLFFSPYSISTALAMTYAGSHGETEKQMMKAMHISLAQENLHSALSDA